MKCNNALDWRGRASRSRQPIHEDLVKQSHMIGDAIKKTQFSFLIRRELPEINSKLYEQLNTCEQFPVTPFAGTSKIQVS